MAEIAHYQRYESGQKGIELYVELERIRDGKSKKNVISLLSDIDSQEAPSWSSGPLYETLNKVALAIINNREEEEIESYLKDNEDNIHSALHTLANIKSTKIKDLAKKVILRDLKASGDCRSIKLAIDFNEADVDFVNGLSEACLESLSKHPISEALEGVESLRSVEFKIKGYEMLLTIAKGDDVLKVVDSIFNVENELATELRKKIPYNEEALKIMTENSTQSFRSQKLNAIQLRNYLENKPNDSKIFDLAYELEFNKKDHIDFAYIDDTFNMLPKTIRALLNQEKMCIIHEGRYVYATDGSDKLMITEKSGPKPEGAGWSFHKQHYGQFNIKNEETRESLKITREGFEVRMTTDYYPYNWELHVIDLSPRVKIIGAFDRFLNIEGNRLVLVEDVSTIWELVPC